MVTWPPATPKVRRNRADILIGPIVVLQVLFKELIGAMKFRAIVCMSVLSTVEFLQMHQVRNMGQKLAGLKEIGVYEQFPEQSPNEPYRLGISRLDDGEGQWAQFWTDEKAPIERLE